VTHEYPQPDGTGQSEAFIVGISDPDGKSASVEAGLQVNHSEHFHSVFGNGVLLAHDADVAATERIDQTFHDCQVWDRNVGSSCWRRRYIRQFRSAYFAVARNKRARF
jgi:hypothetical protein